VRLIGVAAEQRLPALPDVPTFIEQGLAKFTGSTWAGVLAPAGTPREIVQRLSTEIASLVKTDELRQRFEGMGTLPVGSTPEAFERFIADETAKWGEVIRRAKVTPD
jgi:tripartite-type tricarboxylate transporter receptor subunit TctC